MRAPQRAGRTTVARIRQRLSDREIAVLQDVERFRYLSARQIEDLHFYDHASPLTGARTCRRVLRRLTKSTILWQLDRHIGGVRAGSASFVYGVAPLGYRVLHGDEGARVRRHESSATYLDHTLAVAQIAVDLHCQGRTDDLEVVDIQTEPTCWRRFSLGLEGVQELKPDLYAALRTGEYEYHWFVEVDLSTHSAAAAVRKCRLYQNYWATGKEQDRVGVFPRVLLVAYTGRRVALLRRTLDGARGLNLDLFSVTESSGALDHLVGCAS